MAVILTNGTGFQSGIELDELGINIGSYSCRYFPEFKRKLGNKDGQSKLFATPDKFSREISIRGEVSGTTGIAAAALIFNVAFVPANDIALYTAVGGGVYVDQITESQDRDGWRSLDATFSSDPLVV